MKKLLNVNFDYDFEVLAMVSPYKNYRLCHYLNKMLHLNLAYEREHKLKGGKNKKLNSFELYSYLDEVSHLHYRFISNKIDGALLIPELKQPDYFLVIDGDFAENNAFELQNKLKDYTFIQTIFRVKPDELKSKQNFIFE